MLVTHLKFQIVVIQNLDHTSRRYLTKLLRNMCFAFIYIGIKTPIDAKNSIVKELKSKYTISRLIG